MLLVKVSPLFFFFQTRVFVSSFSLSLFEKRPVPFYRARVFATMMKQCTQLGTRNDRHKTERKKYEAKRWEKKEEKAKNVKGDKNNEKGRMNFFG